MALYKEEIPGILSVEIFGADECRAIIDHANSVNHWGEAKVSAPSSSGFHAATKVETRQASVLAPVRASAFTRTFDEKMDTLVKPVVEEVWTVAVQQHSDTHFVRYAPGNFYKTHSDTGINRTDRYFTVICYLNDDFEGGNTRFPQVKYSIRPRTGKAVIFPATYLHCAEPVTTGNKYVLVSWLIGPPPIRWI